LIAAGLQDMTRRLYVYVLASWDRKLYTGVTNNLRTRLTQHRSGESDYTHRHDIHRLVYFEMLGPPMVAIQREKQIKSWTRAKRIALIESKNPDWDDLSPLIGLKRSDS
jgi:putative endonuclease